MYTILYHAHRLLLYTFIAECHEFYTFLSIFLKHVQSIFNGKGIKTRRYLFLSSKVG